MTSPGTRAATSPPARPEIVVDLDAIAANTAVLRERVGRPLMAVVKADGYGHGLVPSARAVLAGGADYLGVAVLA
ncbi:MAG: alanine racemase, partial [Blastococcus sp.]